MNRFRITHEDPLLLNFARNLTDKFHCTVTGATDEDGFWIGFKADESATPDIMAYLHMAGIEEFRLNGKLTRTQPA